MEYEILGDTLPVVICKLQQGESMFTQSGGMGWMTPNFKMSTNIKGGIISGISRRLMKESFFMTTYSCTSGEGIIAFPSKFPGAILTFDLKPGESIIAQKKCFLCAEKTVGIQLYFRPKILFGLFGGEGFIMQKLVGPGKVFLEVDGGVIKHILKPGEALRVDPGHIATMAPTININMRMVKGIMNLFFSGEGILLTELEGPGELCLQTMPIKNIAKSIAPYLHVKKPKKSKGDEEDFITEA